MVHIDIEKATQPLPLTTVFHKLIPIETTPYTFFQTIIGNGYPVSSLYYYIENEYWSVQYSALEYIS
jgi:hypothetical protein